jgi:AcrR family transcriptional regulator
MPRKYELKKRAENVEETQRRIVQAAVALHTTVGPARTTVSAIAERAGVQRQTYYRHFPDERGLFQACSALWTEHHPLPDPGDWAEIADPVERLRVGLGELYRWYDENGDAFATFERDSSVHENTREVFTETLAGIAALRPALAKDAIPKGKKGARATAALDLALDFATWRNLVRGSGLSTTAAAELMADTVLCAAR